jgi:hexosaminidase
MLLLFLSCNTVKSVSPAKENQRIFLNSNQVKLSPPQVLVDSLFFKESAEISMTFELEGADIMYRFGDGKFILYQNPILVHTSYDLSVKSVKEGFKDSDTLVFQLIKVNDILTKAKVTVTPNPHEKYYGNGVFSLVDNKKGSLNIREGNLWCGFQEKVVTLNIEFDTPSRFQFVSISTLSDANSWIFSPEKIKIMLDGKLIKEHSCTLTEKGEEPKFKMIPVSFEPVTGLSLQIVIENMDYIPDWHPGKGSDPWLFMDEIIVE